MSDFCGECGRQLSRFKTNNGHMDSCPTLMENMPSIGRGRKPKNHDSDWSKSGRMKVLGETRYRWRCGRCGKIAFTDSDTAPAVVKHPGSVG
ncbi:MAG TPA: hypothetical protein VKU80_17590 [Planctomycetota bacterium]|nr:hypothetical protein [Planctomycetota bacterium]